MRTATNIEHRHKINLRTTVVVVDAVLCSLTPKRRDMRTGKRNNMKSLWGNRRIKICSAGLCWLFVMLLATTGGSDAAITVDGIEFDSMPAIFGMTWGNNVDYRAHLQSLPNRPFLCEDEDSFLHRNLKKQSTAPLIEPPADNLPIAVLASRGGCSFEEKARVAMNLLNVEIVIVYDDRERSSLVPMSASDPAAITVGMLFVSQSTGSRKFC